MRGSETVLVVEDQEGVRRFVEHVLEHGGYVVIGAADPAAALRAASTNRPIDLLLTDVVMPGASGVELLASLRVTRPGLRVLFMSGFADDAVVHRGIIDPAAAFLPKPFTGPALTRKIREVLDAPVTVGT